jgi:hypothetical protein
VFKPDKRLQKWYQRYNRAFFDGQLPSDVQIGWNELDEMYGTLAASIWTSEEDGLEHKVLQIHIDPKKHYGPCQWKLTLLHECVHLKLLPWQKHGKRFESEMQLLAIKGAFAGLW